MSNSNVSARAIEKPVEITPVVSLTLELTKRDAEALLKLCNNIAGCQKDSPRRVFGRIASELTQLGFRPDNDCVNESMGYGNEFYFKKYKS